MKNHQTLRKNIPFIVGPTAVGKTATAIELAKNLDGEILSIDSRQVYRKLNIGTAKPTLRQQKSIAHHLIDIIDIGSQISAGGYRELAVKTVNEIKNREKWPIFVGGSGLYVKAMLQGIFHKSITDEKIRKRINAELKEQGAAKLYNRLVDIDSETAIKIHINDIKRITRALEIYEITGKPPSHLYKEQKMDPAFPSRVYVLNMERDKLYQRINQRVDEMIAEGLIGEVRDLLDSGLKKELEALRTLGYQEVVRFIDGKSSKTEMIENLKQNTRRYAKRQLTWFRHQIDAVWIDIDTGDSAVDIAGKIVKDLLAHDK